jgi:hypothetical protein
MSIDLSLTIGQDAVPLLSAGTYSWPYVAGVTSVLIPFSAFSALIRANQMSAGNPVVCSVSALSGPYGFVMKGLRADFIGMWVP